MENYDESIEFVKPANEGFFNKLKPKVKSTDAIDTIINPPKLKEIDRKLLKNATFNTPIFPYQKNYMSSNDEKAYKALQAKLRPAMSKAVLKIQSISKKYDCTDYATYFNKVFAEFSKSYEWKTIGQTMMDIQKLEYKYGGIELDDYDVLTDWSVINTEEYTDAILYDFDLASCDQDQFFIFDNIIACLFAAASKKISNSYANCFADDSAVFTLIVKISEPVTEGLTDKIKGAKSSYNYKKYWLPEINRFHREVLSDIDKINQKNHIKDFLLIDSPGTTSKFYKYNHTICSLNWTAIGLPNNPSINHDRPDKKLLSKFNSCLEELKPFVAKWKTDAKKFEPYFKFEYSYIMSPKDDEYYFGLSLECRWVDDNKELKPGLPVLK